jgi:hypothetical protein
LRQIRPDKGHLRALKRTSKFDNSLNVNGLRKNRNYPHHPPPNNPVEISKVAGPDAGRGRIFKCYL